MKKLLSALLAISFSLQASAMAEEYTVFFAEDAVSTKAAKITDASAGFTPIEIPEVEFEHTEEYAWGDYTPFAPFDAATLPEAYDSVELGYITSVKNQNPLGTCWAFSTLSAIETSMIMQGYADSVTADYSERHLSYFAHTPNTYTNDGDESYTSSNGYYDGDHQYYAAQYLAGWQGAAAEEDFPYIQDKDMPNLDESDRYTSVAHLQDFYIIAEEDVKSAVMEYGSVVCAYYDNKDYYSKNNAYYQNVSTSSNHAVTIVGWDDNYALSNFDSLPSKPQNPGAWKIKNSWGTSWGDLGYFWISYEDLSIGDFMAVNAEPADNYNVIHQYDGARGIYPQSVDKSSNIFQADQNQTVKAVGFQTYSSMGRSSLPAPIQYTAEIYRLNSTHSYPEDGTLCSTQEGVVEYEGYHTVELDTPVALNENEYFSVIFTLKYPSGQNAYHVFEGSSDNSSNTGESFVFDDNKWFYSGSTLNNARIKAYSALENVTLSFDTNGGNSMADIALPKYSLLEIPAPPEKDNFYFAGWYKDSSLTALWDFDTEQITENTTLYAKWSETPIEATGIIITGKNGLLTGDSITLSAKIIPYYATDTELHWSSSGDGASVADGVVTGITKGDYVITASLANGINAAHNISVYNPLGEIIFQISAPIYKYTNNVLYQIIEPNASYFELYIINPNNTVSRATLSSSGIYRLSNYIDVSGTYYAYVVAYDPLGNAVRTAVKRYWITPDPTLLASSNADSVTVGAYNGTGTEQVMLAYYNDGRLEKIETHTEGILDLLKTIPYDYSYTELKIMWWDSLNDMSPITTAISISENNNEIILAQ